MENTFEICLCGKGEDGRADDIKFYVTKVSYAHQESSSSTMKKKKEEEKVEHLIPVSVQKTQTCNHFAVLDNKLYFVANDLSVDTPIRMYESSLCHEVWTLDFVCADEGWSRVPQLKTRRCNPHTIVLGGKIYVLGGFEFKKNKNNCFHWMEVLDSIKNGKPLQIPTLTFGRTLSIEC